MSILYNQFQLSNSNKIPEYQGSVIPELTKVAQDRQNKWDLGMQQADLLDELLKNASSSTFDQKTLDNLKRGAREKLTGYASANDYENTYRKVALDARDFVGKYKHIAANKQAIAQYQNELEKSLEKGDIKDPDTIRKAMAYSTYGYKGLQFDEATGQYTNQFRGTNLAKEIDIPKKLDDWMSNYAPQVLGSATQKIEGDYYVQREGKTVKLGQNEIDKVINAGKSLDKEYQAYVKQERNFNTIGYEKATPDMLEQLKAQHPGEAPAIQKHLESYMSNGLSFGDAFKKTAEDIKEGEINKSISEYSSKFKRNDRESSMRVMKESEDKGRRAAEEKELRDVLMLTSEILQPNLSVAFNPGKLNGKIKELSDATATLQQNLATWAANEKMTKKGDNFYNKDGVDVTEVYQKKLDLVTQSVRVKDNMKMFQDKAKAEADYNDKDITQTVRTKAQQAYDNTFKATNTDYENNMGVKVKGEQFTEVQRRERAEAAYDQVIRSSNPAGYDRYKSKLQEYSQQTALVGVQPFKTERQNKMAETAFQSFALNLDAKGLDFGSFGLQWGTGEKANEALSAKDYKDVRDKVVFAGTGIDTDGQYKYFYKVGDVKSKDGGKEMVIKMPALAGTSQILIQNGQISEAQQYLTQNLARLPNIGKLDVGPGLSVGVNKQADGTYELDFPIENGKIKRVAVSSRAEAVTSIIEALKK